MGSMTTEARVLPGPTVVKECVLATWPLTASPLVPSRQIGLAPCRHGRRGVGYCHGGFAQDVAAYTTLIRDYCKPTTKTKTMMTKAPFVAALSRTDDKDYLRKSYWQDQASVERPWKELVTDLLMEGTSDERSTGDVEEGAGNGIADSKVGIAIAYFGVGNGNADSKVGFGNADLPTPNSAFAMPTLRAGIRSPGHQVANVAIWYAIADREVGFWRFTGAWSLDKDLILCSPTPPRSTISHQGISD
ncbi:hypothetical protein Taro_020869 [Colocasia esculenta]|uniref:Uncharacterized protein n=1 Tax=Colocasia esculenta TaxID=4460 RepID=A0A843V3D9_COLES|nr:hypothetical protein [Colocasia esculenta]